MRARLLAVAATILFATVAGAEQKSVMQYLPISCVRAGELPLMQLNIDPAAKGELRAYFRRVNTTDWCSVEGVNEGPLSRVVLPKFEKGDEFEYFFVLLDGRRVVARSQRIYRVRVDDQCQSPFARHILPISLSCGQDDMIPAAVGAGLSVTDKLIEDTPPQGSPDRPNGNQ